MDQGPLVTEQIDAGLAFLGEYQKRIPVQLAFWVKDLEGRWRLYVASEAISDENFTRRYSEVARITNENPDPWLDPFQVRVIGMDDPMAKAALNVIQKDLKNMYKRFRPGNLGPVYVEEVYIYPLCEGFDMDSWQQRASVGNASKASESST